MAEWWSGASLPTRLFLSQAETWASNWAFCDATPECPLGASSQPGEGGRLDFPPGSLFFWHLQAGKTFLLPSAVSGWLPLLGALVGEGADPWGFCLYSLPFFWVVASSATRLGSVRPEENSGNSTTAFFLEPQFPSLVCLLLPPQSHGPCICDVQGF